MSRRQRAALAFWLSAITTLVVVDVELAAGEADGDTLSEVQRLLPLPAWLTAWFAFNTWYVPHIVKGYKNGARLWLTRRSS